MHQPNSNIQLSPWISVPKGFKTTQNSQLIIRKEYQKQVILITVLSIKPQNLSLIGKFTFAFEDINQQTVAFISPVIYQRQMPFQIAYIPHRQTKPQYDCIQTIAQIVKAVSEIVITDVNCNGHHKYKHKSLSKFDEAQQFVIVNNKDVYQIEVKQSKIELSKAAHFSIVGTQPWIMPQINATPKFVNFGLISTVFHQYFQQFLWFLNSDKNWKCLADLTLSRYRSQMHLNQCFGLDDEGKSKKILSVQQMKTIQNEILSYARDDKNSMTKWIASMMIANIKRQNNNFIDILLALKQNFVEREVKNQQQFNLTVEEAIKSLNDYQISEQFITFLTGRHQQSLLQKEIDKLREKQQILKESMMQRNNQLMLKSHKIEQLKEMLQQFAQKAEEMKQNTQQLIDVTELYEKEKQNNWKLQIQVDSHIFISKKCADAQLALQSQIKSLMKDKADLLLALQQLTSQNLFLMNQRQSSNQQISDLRERISDSNQVQARALKSIQNQAQIKVRLNRYQNYVMELKQVFNSFKKLQIQKFNYILHHNYKEYSEIQQRLKFSQFELRRSQLRVKELTQSLHCERVKLSYLQRIYASSYQNDVILQVSEENSATDRQLTQNA